MKAFFFQYWPWFILYFAGMSLLCFGLMGFDKGRARRGGWRVRERTFFLTAALGGSPGAVLGMFFFHHKTRHWYFRFGLPAILLLQLAMGLGLWLRP